MAGGPPRSQLEDTTSWILVSDVPSIFFFLHLRFYHLGSRCAPLNEPFALACLGTRAHGIVACVLCSWESPVVCVIAIRPSDCPAMLRRANTPDFTCSFCLQSVDLYLGCLRFGTITDKAAVNTPAYFLGTGGISFFTSECGFLLPKD